VAQEEMVIQSGEAEYNGKEIVLTGLVHIDHELGSIQAQQIRILPSLHKDQKAKFSHLQMLGDVHIRFKEGGSLKCQQADLDYAALRGVFIGNEEHPDVYYTQPARRSDNDNGFTLTSNQMTLRLRRLEKKQGSFETSLQSIEASKGVHFCYQDYMAVAETATLYKQESSTGSLLDQSIITLSESERNKCRLMTKQGDWIEALQIILDVNQQKLVFAEPKGRLMVGQKESDQKTVDFSADQLVWDGNTNALSLLGNVQLLQEGNGQLETKEATHLFYQQNPSSKKRELVAIISDRDTILTYKDEAKGLSHQVICPGSFKIDHQQKMIFLNGKKDEKGEMEEKNQVFFEDLLGDIYADAMQIDYRGDRLFQPISLHMAGHVKIFNRFNGHMEESGLVLQYALADRVSYSLEQKEMLLKGADKRRVLFFDKVNHIQMSAPGLKIRHQGESGQESIRGIGDVHFTFIEKEFEELRQRFKFDSKLP
jgi:hypothetical protein